MRAVFQLLSSVIGNEIVKLLFKLYNKIIYLTRSHANISMLMGPTRVNGDISIQEPAGVKTCQPSWLYQFHLGELSFSILRARTNNHCLSQSESIISRAALFCSS